MDHRNHPQAAHTFAASFASALSAALAQAGGSPWPLEVGESQEPPARDARPCQFRIQWHGSLNGECYVEFYEPQFAALLERIGARPGEEASGDSGAVFGPILSAAADGMKPMLAARFGEVSAKVESVSGLTCGGMFLVPLRVRSEQPAPSSVFLYFDSALLQALSSTAPAGMAQGQFQPSNLRLVMDVELNVSLRFGQRQLPLREVLELASGSVVELDRSVDEPVEMLLDGKVVARGEAVIVDGNYGLRVTEIPQALESHLLGA